MSSAWADPPRVSRRQLADLYVRDGSRFVLYDPARQHTPPIPVPVETVETGGEDRHYKVTAPRCPHGHFARWAVRNCRSCR